MITTHITIPPAGVGYVFPPLQAKQYLLVKADETAQRIGGTVEMAVISGPAPESIVDYISKNEIDLVAFATHGRAGLERALVGSVTDHVLRDSGIPAIVIKPQNNKR